MLRSCKRKQTVSGWSSQFSCDVFSVACCWCRLVKERRRSVTFKCLWLSLNFLAFPTLDSFHRSRPLMAMYRYCICLQALENGWLVAINLSHDELPCQYVSKLYSLVYGSIYVEECHIPQHECRHHCQPDRGVTSASGC